MMESTFNPNIEDQIREWRSYLLRRRTIHHVDVDELEDHLRSEISQLGAVGLSGDESFLVAIKRIGGVNELSREFARERSSRLWKQLVLAGDTVRSGSWYFELLVMTEELRRDLVTGLDLAAIRERLRADGMPTLRDDAWSKVQAGLTTVEEVLRVVE